MEKKGLEAGEKRAGQKRGFVEETLRGLYAAYGKLALGQTNVVTSWRRQQQTEKIF